MNTLSVMSDFGHTSLKLSGISRERIYLRGFKGTYCLHVWADFEDKEGLDIEDGITLWQLGCIPADITVRIIKNGLTVFEDKLDNLTEDDMKTVEARNSDNVVSIHAHN